MDATISPQDRVREITQGLWLCGKLNASAALRRFCGTCVETSVTWMLLVILRLVTSVTGNSPGLRP